MRYAHTASNQYPTMQCSILPLSKLMYASALMNLHKLCAHRPNQQQTDTDAVMQQPRQPWQLHAQHGGYHRQCQYAPLPPAPNRSAYVTYATT